VLASPSKSRGARIKLKVFFEWRASTLMGAGAFFNKPASYLGEQVYTNELGLFVR